MPQRAITKAFVDEVRPTGKDAFYWDVREKGFGLKVAAGGAKSYVYQYRLGGREAPTRRYTIGRHGSPYTPDTARKRARELMLLVEANIDPMQAERRQRRERVELAFSSYVELFIAQYLRPQWRGGGGNAEGYLRRNAIPHFGRQALTEIDRADIAAMVAKIESVASRRNTFAVLRKLFRWAVGRGDLDASPMRDMDVPQAPPHRERALTDKELSLVWHGADALGYPFGPMVTLLILTGQRRAEVAGLRWEEVDQARREWVLPAARSKNDKMHLVPLSVRAVAVLDDVARETGGISTDAAVVWPRKGLIFTSTGTTPVSGYSGAKRRLDRAVNELVEKLAADKPDDGWSEPEAWRLHDLRRTLATGMQRLKVRLEVTEGVLNHTSGSRAGIVKVYQVHEYAEEKREALDIWDDQMGRIIALAKPRDDAAPDAAVSRRSWRQAGRPSGR